MFIQHLRSRKIEILLRDMHPPFPQRIHPRLGTDALELCAATAVHFLRDLEEVYPACEVHAAAVDAEDVGAGFDSGIVS